MIIGLTGPICAGTDSVARILESKGFLGFSYSDIIREEAKKRNIEITRKNLQDLGDQLRKERGPGVLSKIIIENLPESKDLVVGDMRNPGEVEVFRKKFGNKFSLLLVDAPLNIRFERILERHRESDPETIEGFKKLEEKDLGTNEANYGQQHARVFPLADHKITNDSNLEDLEKKVEELLTKIKTSN